MLHILIGFLHQCEEMDECQPKTNTFRSGYAIQTNITYLTTQGFIHVVDTA